MNALIDSTFVPLRLKSSFFLGLAFLLWPIARQQSAALQSVYWRGVTAGLSVLGAFSVSAPIVEIERRGVGG
jgi:hypothetical protein